MRRFFRKAEDGSVTVEFVVGLPLLLLALVFVFEFSSLFWAHHIATNNVRSATRFLSRAPLVEPFLTEATNIAKTGNPAKVTGSYDWMKKTCAAGGLCVTIDQSFATFTAADFRVAGTIIKVQADIPFPMPLFGLINTFSGGNIPKTLTLRIVEEMRHIGE